MFILDEDDSKFKKVMQPTIHIVLNKFKGWTCALPLDISAPVAYPNAQQMSQPSCDKSEFVLHVGLSQPPAKMLNI